MKKRIMVDTFRATLISATFLLCASLSLTAISQTPAATTEKRVTTLKLEDAINRGKVDSNKAADKPDADVQELSPHIALIVPTLSSQLGKMAEALRRGFMTAADVDGRTAPVKIYPVNDEGDSLAKALLDANSRGAVIAVGALTRDGATLMNATSQNAFANPMALLALNQPQQSVNDPEMMSFLSLNVEHESRLAAQNAFADGFRTPIVIASATALARRMQEAFEREWLRLAGEPAKSIRFTGLRDGEVTKTKAAGHNPDFIFFAMNASEARAARPYLPRAQMMGTSQLNEFSDPTRNLDLNGARFVEMPWLVQLDHPAVAIYNRPTNLSLDQQRVYALGIDAYRLATVLIKPRRMQSRMVDGVTGKLELETDGSILRTPASAELVDGRTVERP
jgi:uncharacterized protein